MSTSRSTPAPDYGRRLPPALIDELAAIDPEFSLYSVPKSVNLADGFEDISVKRVANAVNRAAMWLQQTLGVDSGRTFCYMGPLDMRYMFLALGAPKAGSLAFFSSHRNSLEAHLSLVQRTSCSAFLSPKVPLPVVDQIVTGHQMETITIPDLEWFLDEKNVEAIPFTKSFDEVKDKPFVMLHTSGSTGIPKPVAVTYGSYAGMDAQLSISGLGYGKTFIEFAAGKRVVFALPAFHAATLNWTVGVALFARTTCILPPPSPLTADVASQMFVHSRCQGVLMAPSLAVDCYNDDLYRNRLLSNLDFVSYVGGLLPKEVGEALCTKIKLITLLGSCETSLLPLQMHDDAQDWEYICISPACGATWREEREGLCNLVITRNKKLERYQGVFSTFPKKDEHAMGDLFERHPRNAGLWRFRARVDDIISFTTAEKLNPITMESVIQASPLVRSAVIGGQGQFQASLLLEPREFPQTKSEEDALLAAVWPNIVQANKDCPAHGRIMKGFVMVSNPAKPLPRASKDTVQRHQVFKLYEKEWEDLYARMANHNRADDSHSKTTIPSLPTRSASNSDRQNSTFISAQVANAVDEAVQKHVASALDRLAEAFLAAASHLRSDGVPTSASRAVPCSETNDPLHSQGQNWTGTTPQEQLHQVILGDLAENIEIDRITDDANLFDFGLDSLRVPSLLKAINTWITESHKEASLVERQVIYDNPTVNRLVRAIL